MSDSKRIPQLDEVWGLAILMVLLCHYIQIPLLELPGPFAKYLAKSLSLTWSGVDLFFVLSGFLICGILADHHRSPSLFKTFYARRTARIFPVYFLMLLYFVVGSRTFGIPNLFEPALPLWSYATFTQNFVMANRPEEFFLDWTLLVIGG